jgi:hypothetical protein
MFKRLISIALIAASTVAIALPARAVEDNVPTPDEYDFAVMLNHVVTLGSPESGFSMTAAYQFVPFAHKYCLFRRNGGESSQLLNIASKAQFPDMSAAAIDLRTLVSIAAMASAESEICPDVH